MYAITLNGFISYGGYKKKSLSSDGAITGFLVGMLHALAGWSPIVLLFLFFVSSSMATKRGQKRKQKLEEDFKEGTFSPLSTVHLLQGGQRNWTQVLCNGGPQALFCLLYLLNFGITEHGLDMKNHFWETTLILSVMGYLLLSLHPNKKKRICLCKWRHLELRIWCLVSK